MAHDGADQTVLGYYLFRLAGMVLPHIPARVAYPLASRAGDLYHFLMPRHTRGVASNMSHVLGQPLHSRAVREAVHRVCRNLALNFYDMFLVPTLSPDTITRRVAVTGWEHVLAAREVGRGIVLVSLHFGNLDLVMQVLAARGLPVTILAEHLKPDQLFEYVWSLRTSHGVLRVLPVDGPLVQVVRALRRNDAVALAVDRNITGSGRWVDFFGAPALLPDSPVRLALRTGAEIIAAFGGRRPGNRYVASFCPVPLERGGELDAGIDRGMMSLVGVLETQILADPGQWFLTTALWDQPTSA